MALYQTIRRSDDEVSFSSREVVETILEYFLDILESAEKLAYYWAQDKTNKKLIQKWEKEETLRRNGYPLPEMSTLKKVFSTCQSISPSNPFSVLTEYFDKYMEAHFKKGDPYPPFYDAYGKIKEAKEGNNGKLERVVAHLDILKSFLSP